VEQSVQIWNGDHLDLSRAWGRPERRDHARFLHLSRVAQRDAGI